MKRIIFFLCLFSLSTFTVNAQWYEKSFHVMGTQAKVQFWYEDAKKAGLLISAVENEMERINQSMSPYIESSELSQVNLNAAKQPFKISDELFNLLIKANNIARLSNGAFDITYASVGYQYHYRDKIKPNEKTIKANLNKINYQGIALDKVNKTIFFSKEGMKIDLGGIAKGYAVKTSLRLLEQAGVKNALVSAGGDTGLLGDKRGRPWVVGIKHPRAEQKNAVHLPLENEAISTSGDYERYFIENGERYHHILNPKTGKSAKEVVSVSVIGKDPTMVDALSTTLFVLGLKPAMKMIDSLVGYEVIIIDKNQKLHFSKGLTQ
jgi:thiamine biosynthesis lipoprotein